MKKRLLIIGILLIALLLPLLSSAQRVSPVQDSAAVLSTETLDDLRTLSQRSRKETDITLALETRHFLGGADVNSYARRLLAELEDPDDSLLMLMVIGEESYALAAGSKAARLLSAEARETLLSTAFRAPFLSRDYDKAAAELFTGLARRLASASDQTVKSDDLFGRQDVATPAPTAAPQARPTYKVIDLTGPNSILGDRVQPPRSPVPQYDQERENKGMSIGSIVLIGLVLSMLFGKKDGRRRGCGCGPLGWIFGVFGFSKLFGWRK